MKQNDYLILIGSLFLIPCLILIMPMDNMSPVGSSKAPQPPQIEDVTTFWDGDWDVDSNSVYQNQTIIVNGNLTVLGGFSLTLINVTIRMNNTGNMTTYIHVNNGASISISDFDNDPMTKEDGSNITSNITDGSHRFGFWAHQNSGITVTNSIISQIGHDIGFNDYEKAIYIQTSNAVFRNTTISKGYRGIHVFEGSGSIIEHCIFHSLEDDKLRIETTSDMWILNNSIDVDGSGDFGIYIQSDSWRNRIVGNTINVSGSNAEGIRDASSGRWNEIEQNLINVFDGADGIQIFTSYTNITSNTILEGGVSCDGIALSFGGFINVSDNTIVASGINVFAIKFGNVNNITFLNNNISISDNNCRGMDLGSSAHDIFIDNLTISVTSGINNFGIYFNGAYDIIITNSSINGAQTDMDLNSDSHVTVINTDFSTFDVSDALSDLTVQNYLDITVEDWMGVPQPGALIQIKNSTGDTVFSGSPDANGQIRFLPLTEVVHYQGSSIYATPHNITITASGYDPWTTDVNMDQGRIVNVILLPQGASGTIRLGDWWIDTTEEYWNLSFLMDGNITINATGNLILNNCTIMFNATLFNSQYYLNVTWGGELHLFDNDWDNYTQEDASVITDSPYDTDDGSANDFTFSFYAWAGSVIEIRNSQVIDCGWESPSIHDEGIFVETDSAVFNHAYIQGNFIGINFADSTNSMVYNSTIIINGYWNFSSAIRAWGCPNLQILNNNVDITATANDDLGIFVGNSQGSIIQGNLLHMSGTIGVNYGIFVTDSSDYTVSDNTVTFNAPGMAMNFNLMNSCSVSRNNIFVSVTWGTGIFFSDVTNSQFDQNTVTLSVAGSGIYLTGSLLNTFINDLTITGNTASIDGVFIGDGDEATLTNITIDLPGVGSYGFTVDNSENITIRNLNLTVTNTWGAGLTFQGGSRNCLVEESYITTNGFINALIGNNCSNIRVVNSTLNSAITFDVEVMQNSSVTLVNPTFLNYDITEPLSTLTVMWYLNVQVIDEFGLPFPGINVRIEEADSTEVRTSLVNSNGWLNWTVCTGYVATESGVFNSTNMHTIRAFNATCWDEVQVDLTNSNQIVVIALINEDPVIVNPFFNIQVMEDSWDNRTFIATDWEGNSLIWSISPNLGWINMNPITGNLTISPSDLQVGDTDFTIRVTDENGGFDEFVVNVDVLNRPPEILTTNILIAFEDLPYYRDYDSDDDPNTTWKIENGPSWLNIDDVTGEISGTPDNSDTGFVTINISVDDEHGDTTYNEFVLWVINVNPNITTADVLISNEDELYQVNYQSSDDGQGLINWSLITDANWLTINPSSGILSGTPTNINVGDWTVNVSVNDGNGGIAFSNFTLTVISAPPVITTIDIPWADEDSLYYVDYASSDDGEGNITYSLYSDATWLSINSTTGILSGTPQNEDVDSYWVKVTVDDGWGETGSHNFSLTVNNTNDSPVIITIDVLTAVEDQIYLVNYQATDDDGDILSWSLNTPASWLSIDSNSGELSGTPTNLDVGSWDVTVSCDDGNGGTHSHSFSIVVSNVNDAPQITYFIPSGEFPSVEEGLTLEFNISYSDEDSSTFSVIWTLDGNIVRQNVPFWSYQPDFGEAGDHDVAVNITDDQGAGAIKIWRVIVSQANRAPIIDSYGPMDLKPVIGPEDLEMEFNVNAQDPDSDSLVYEWYLNGNDTGVRTPTFTLDRAEYGEGTYDLEVRVIDENDTVTSQNWEVTVQPEIEEKTEPESSNIFLILAIVVAIVIVLLVIYLLKKGKTQIEDIFIITNHGILLAHKSKEFHPDMDDDIMGSMLTAVQDFVKDSFKEKSKFGLKRLDFGDSVIHIQPGKNIYAAVILSGEETADFEESLEKLVSDIEIKYADVLEEWDGDLDTVRGLKDMLDDLVK
jgi:hypothetical protein